ncbi:hypothetical protein [Comamonas thiooxydans]|nr:hypothetical protein [Comamonas thiooxydans]
MSTYTVSRLALEAGMSVHIVRAVLRQLVECRREALTSLECS